MDWSLALFAVKWLLLGLVYLAVLLLVITVQREMRQRLPGTESAAPAVSFGRLRVLRPGSDARLRAGLLLSLPPQAGLGSAPENTLVLQDPYISSQHARVRWDGAAWWVEDLNSTNGTFVNQQRVSPGAPVALPGGAILEIGDLAFEMVE